VREVRARATYATVKAVICTVKEKGVLVPFMVAEPVTLA